MTLPLGEYTTSHIPTRWPIRISYAWSPQLSYSTYSSHRSVVVACFTPLIALIGWCVCRESVVCFIVVYWVTC